MMSAASSSNTGRINRSCSPFTAAQWQELEHQALFFKYMVSGVPIPPELIYSIRTSFHSSSLPSTFFPQQPSGGWDYLQMGYGKKIDPEPGRCRRTDGKKWRCSKEASSDSKYCERHMHRGRNRSRKSVESSNNMNTITTTTTTKPSSTNTNNSLMFSTSASNSSSSIPPPSYDIYPHKISSNKFSPFLSSSTTSVSCRPLDSCISLQNPTSVLDTVSCSLLQPDKDFRYFHEMKESMDERAFFPEVSNNQPLTMNSYKDYSSHDQYQPNFQDYLKQQQEQHCFVLGTDIKLSRPMKTGKEEQDETGRKPLHHFFGDWSPKNTDSWLDLAPNSSPQTDC